MPLGDGSDEGVLEKDRQMTPASPTFCRLIEMVCEKVELREAARERGGFTVELVRVRGGALPDAADN